MQNMHNVKAFAPLVIHLDIVLGAINDWESDTHTLTFTAKLRHTLQIFVREKMVTLNCTFVARIWRQSSQIYRSQRYTRAIN